MQALREAGLCIPEDVSVVAYNDNPVAAYFNPICQLCASLCEMLERSVCRFCFAPSEVKDWNKRNFFCAPN
jgi:DNA-binding LacI/PurR family transcriptional regulator